MVVVASDKIIVGFLLFRW